MKPTASPAAVEAPSNEMDQTDRPMGTDFYINAMTRPEKDQTDQPTGINFHRYTMTHPEKDQTD